MNSAVLLAKDNEDSCAVYEKQLQKGIWSKKQIAIKEGLSILFRRGQDLLQSENQADEVASTAPAEPAPEAEKCSIHAPPQLVIAILLDIGDCNAPVTIAISFLY